MINYNFQEKMCQGILSCHINHALLEGSSNSMVP